VYTARPRARSPTPSASKAANAFGPSCTPAPISPIWAACSSTLTGYPRRESASAHASPPIPPPAISTGAYGFPADRAARIAVREVRRFLETDSHLHEVLLVCYDPEAYRIFAEALAAESRPSDRY